jgi:hypothetical protein
LATLVSSTACNIDARFPGAIIVDENGGRELVRIVHNGDDFWVPRYRGKKYTTQTVIAPEPEETDSEFKELSIGREPVIEDEIESEESNESVQDEDSEYLAAE